jgi:hypothetical protein
MNTFKNKITLCASLAAIVCVSAFNATAQDATTEDKKIEFGVRLMPTISSFQMQTSDGSTIKGQATLGWGGGAFVGYNFTQHVGVQAELLYFSVSQQNKEGDVTRKVNLRYVNIPLLLSLNTGKSKPVNVNVVVGPQLGVSAGGDVTTSGGNDITTPDARVVVKTTDVGLAYGAGLDFGLNEARTFRLGIGFRGVYGMFDVSDDSGNYNSNEYLVLDKSHVKTYSAYVGVSILL